MYYIRDGLAHWFITGVTGPCVFRVYGAGVVAVSIEGPDISELLGHSESRDILSPVRHFFEYQAVFKDCSGKQGTASSPP